MSIADTAPQFASDVPVGRNAKLSETVAKRIVDEIFADQLPVGTKLPPERVMLERLGVSRGTLREALRILEVHGMLVIKSGPGGGPTVSAMTPSDFNKACSLHFKAAGITVEQLWQARAGLEPTLARLAAMNLTDESRATLEKLVEEARNSRIDDNSRYIRIGSSFHREIAIASGNPVLTLFARSLGEMTTYLESRNVFAPSEHPRVHTAHIEIAEAILAGDADQAERLSSEHMQDMADTHNQRYSGLLNNVLPYIIDAPLREYSS